MLSHSMVTKLLVVSRDRILRDKLHCLIDRQSDVHVICDAIDVMEAAARRCRNAKTLLTQNHPAHKRDEIKLHIRMNLP